MVIVAMYATRSVFNNGCDGIKVCVALCQHGSCSEFALMQSANVFVNGNKRVRMGKCVNASVTL